MCVCGQTVERLQPFKIHDKSVIIYHCGWKWSYSMSSLILQQQAKKSRIVASNEIPDKSRAAACFGSSCLTELLAGFAAKTKNGASLRVGVVGEYSFSDICFWWCSFFRDHDGIIGLWEKLMSTAESRSWVIVGKADKLRFIALIRLWQSDGILTYWLTFSETTQLLLTVT